MLKCGHCTFVRKILADMIPHAYKSSNKIYRTSVALSLYVSFNLSAASTSTALINPIKKYVPTVSDPIIWMRFWLELTFDFWTLLPLIGIQTSEVIWRKISPWIWTPPKLACKPLFWIICWNNKEVDNALTSITNLTGSEFLFILPAFGLAT